MDAQEQIRALEKRISFLERLEPGTGLIDYFATSTKVGWSAYTVSGLLYKRIGGLMYVFFFVEGTSNAATASVTLPYNCILDYTQNRIGTYDTSVLYSNGFATISSGSNVLAFSPDAAGTAWQVAGTKRVIGEIVVPV